MYRWRFIVHGGVDGFSRFIVYLWCSTNNRSDTMLTLFHNAVVEFGLPQRVRCDKGGENVKVSQVTKFDCVFCTVSIGGHNNYVIISL